jgi:hypothetical protein
MKTLISLVLALLTGFTVEGAIGQLPIGSSNVVETYNFTSSTFAQSSVRWTKTNGVTALRFGGNAIPPMSKQQLLSYNQQFLTNELNLSVGSDPQADKTKPVIFGALYTRNECPYWLLSTRSQTITYTTNGQIPDLSSINPYGGDQAITIAIKNLRWARFEVTTTNNPSQPYYVIDSRTQTNPPTSSNPNGVEKDTIFNWGCLTMALPFACSGTNGAYRVKVYIVSGTNNDYEIFDGTGTRVSETPLQVSSPTFVGNTIKLDVTGGDIGRVIAVEKSTDLLNWKVCAGTTNVISSGRVCHISIPKGDENRLFFRAKMVAIAPTEIQMPQPRIEGFGLTNNTVQFDVIGADFGSKFVIEKNIDFVGWVQYPTTNVVSGTTTHIVLTKGPESQAYFRTKSVQ